MSKKYKYVNEEEKFWENSYRVWLSEFSDVIVNANNEQDALDYAIDYATKQKWEGLFLTPEEVKEIEEEGNIEDYICGGNESRYLSSLNVHIELLED